MAKLHFLYSVMNAGKSAHLLQVHHNYSMNLGNVVLFTSVIDDRFGRGKIKSRMGVEADADALKPADDVFRIVLEKHASIPITAVLLDEVQFLSRDQIRQLARIVDELRIPVMAYGLKNNAFGELFSDSIATLLALADQIHEIKQLCHCGSKATMILKYDKAGTAIKSGAVIEVGAEDRYVSVCRPHWNEGDIGPLARRKLTRPVAEAVEEV
jgi:thymidine kinase